MANASSVIEQTEEYFVKVREHYKEVIAKAYESNALDIENIHKIGARLAALNDVRQALQSAADSETIDEHFKETE